MLNIDFQQINLNSGGAFQLLLSDIQLQILPGRTTILAGANGTGKSTFMLASLKLADPTIIEVKGSVIYNNVDLIKAPIDILNQIRHSKIKCIFQDPVHCFDPLKKIKYYFNLNNTPREEIERIFDFFLLPVYEHIAELYPHQLSVGMAQRILLSLAFLAEPEIIFFDEPNSALDAISSSLLTQKIKEYCSKGGTAVVITQDMNFARNAGDIFYELRNNTIHKMNGF